MRLNFGISLQQQFKFIRCSYRNLLVLKLDLPNISAPLLEYLCLNIDKIKSISKNNINAKNRNTPEGILASNV